MKDFLPYDDMANILRENATIKDGKLVSAIPATLFKGWNWKCYEDGQGWLADPNGDKYISFYIWDTETDWLEVSRGWEIRGKMKGIPYIACCSGFLKFMKIGESYLQQCLDKEDVYKMRVEDLNLSTRAYNCLRRAGVNTVEELCRRTVEDVLKFRNVGPILLQEIEKRLNEYGIRLMREAELNQW